MKFLNIVKRLKREIKLLQREMERVEVIDEQLRKQWTESINIVMEHKKWLGIGRRQLTVLNRSNGRMIVLDEKIESVTRMIHEPPVKPYKTKRVQTRIRKQAIHNPCERAEHRFDIMNTGIICFPYRFKKTLKK